MSENVDLGGLSPAQRRRLREELERQKQAALAKLHPAHLLEHVRAVDTTSGEEFKFQLVEPCDHPANERHEGCCWYWQRHVLDAMLDNNKSLWLKARQIGITWLAAGLALWNCLYNPGTRTLVYSITEDDAVLVVHRIWGMFESLPEHLKNGVEVMIPARGLPHQDIRLRHANGQISTIRARPSTKKSGHGETASLIILDEFSRQEYAKEVWTSTLPAISRGGRVVIISTANGVSNEETGEGNYFHYLYVNRDDKQIVGGFLPWNLHPDRDDAWYAEWAMALADNERNEQFPRTPEDAFIFTGDPYFDVESLRWYSEEAVQKPLYRMRFEGYAHKARIVKSPRGWIRVYERPRPGVPYCIGADVATGKGKDYSSAHVLDLTSGAVVAELHGKLDADVYAEQLHFLGRWYNDAWLIVERGGGYGESVITHLKDTRKEGRPAYPNLYRHRAFTRGKKNLSEEWGYPVSVKSRTPLLSTTRQMIRERAYPTLSRETLQEYRTFITAADGGPSPRAQEGTNDDRVFSLALASEGFRQRGEHPHPRRKKQNRRHNTFYWQEDNTP